MRKKEFRVFSADFETTVYEGQTFTEVWASALVELGTEDVVVHHSIAETFEYLTKLEGNIILYYHNLKFDGNYWISFILRELKYKEASTQDGDDYTTFRFQREKDMANKTFKYVINDMGQWYSITIKVKNKYIVIQDSLKLLPFSVKQIGKAFKTKHQKLEMEYKGRRYAGCEITEDELEYIRNDVLVVKEALEFMYAQGNKDLTIGSCCLKEYRKTIGEYDYKDWLPDMTVIKLTKERHGAENVDEWIRKSYRGGWCYLAKGKENKIYKEGTTADVNSLYPSMMSSMSGNKYPVGLPHFWEGDKIPDICKGKNAFYFIRIKTRFYLKPGKLPFIQIKGTFLYSPNECLETSDVYDRKTGKYYSKMIGFNGEIKDTRVELTLTEIDYKLFLEHYDVEDFEIIDGCWFYTTTCDLLFDQYINKYKKIKMESTGALRTLAKLYLNNLYGKMASSKDSSFKVAYLKEDESIGFYTIKAYDKKAGYIPIGSAITSYARNFTIRAAQANYYGPDKPGFIYADTDSIHCDLKPEEMKGIQVDDKEFCCWKLESCWDKGIFVRQKTYIEHVTHEDLTPVDEPYYNIKCAGMPDTCKKLLEWSMNNHQLTDKERSKLTDEQIEFIETPRTMTDFKKGLRISGKLLPKRIPGGVLLIDTYYELR